MSRSGYTDEDEEGTRGLYRANVDRAMNGKRGQQFLRDLVTALDAMPEKRLVQGALEEDGEVCSLGALCRFKSKDPAPLVEDWDEADWGALGKLFNVAPMLTQEVMFWNDDDFGFYPNETPEERWQRMREWARNLIRGAAA